MTDVKALLERQAQWQKRRATLPWPDKIRLAERVRDSVQQLRGTKTTSDALRRNLPKSPSDR